jgi:putative PIN family toxin of toxin-antitoxin system
MIRVVLDTNVIVSAYLNQNGVPFLILKLALARAIQPYVSEPILAEYGELLRRKSYPLDRRRARLLLNAIRGACILVTPQPGSSLTNDPDDTKFLECAQAAKADYLVTGNMSHFPTGRWKYTRIVTPREFIEIWAESAERRHPE